jgi:hypothetical protein
VVDGTILGGTGRLVDDAWEFAMAGFRSYSRRTVRVLLRHDLLVALLFYVYHPPKSPEKGRGIATAQDM